MPQSQLPITQSFFMFRVIALQNLGSVRRKYNEMCPFYLC